MFIKRTITAVIVTFAISSTSFLHAANGERKNGSTTLPNGCSFNWSLWETGIGTSSHQGYCELIAGAGCRELQTKLFYFRSDRTGVVFGRDGYRRSSAVTVIRSKNGSNLTDALSCDFNATGEFDSSRWGFKVQLKNENLAKFFPTAGFSNKYY